MLSRTHRLTKESDFQRVFRRGRAVATTNLVLKYLKGGRVNSRVGLVISKKVSKKATERNRISRRLKAVVAGFLPSFSTGGDVVIVVNRAEVGQLSPVLLRKEVATLLRRAGLI